MLKVYIADCTPFAEPDVFRRGLALVKEERKDRILSFRSHADRQRSLSATLLLRLALEKEGISYADSCFRIEANGKPQLCDQGLYFSLSHSGDRALCALADCEVGADIELLSRFGKDENKARQVARRCLTADEMVQLEASDDFCENLIRMWTKKESYVKLTGEGLACDFTSVDTIRRGFYEQRSLSGGYCATVCTRKSCSGILWFEGTKFIYE